jgi:phosphoglycerol transferase MdoB-like AlkP superfamily enzyme
MKVSLDRVPQTIQWVVRIFGVYLLLFTLFRVITAICFKPGLMSITEMLPAFWIGLKYDLRWVSIILSPVILFSSFPPFSPYKNLRAGTFWSIYLGCITLIVLIFYGADFGQFAYVDARLNADALIFAEDPKESWQMIWESYPVVWILISILLAVLFMYRFFSNLKKQVEQQNAHKHKFSFQRRWHLAALLMTCWFIYGFLTWEPLNVKRAMNLNNGFKSNLALNPMQNFFTTLGFRQQAPNDAAAYYSSMSALLGLPKTPIQPHPYKRIIKATDRSISQKPNVVLVICESMSMYKTSMAPNPLATTPFLAQVAKDGVFFDRCFSTSFGTARSLFGTISGVPDVQLGKFATRDPASVQQQTIINSWTGYSKHYFIGGRSSFNNFRGVVSNVNNIQFHEEGSFTAPKTNVWGISDKDLFSEANKVFTKQTDPFFAIIQTSGNHRPFQIPAAERAFVRRVIPEDSLRRYGFESQDEFDAFHYMDYCIQSFMETAAKEPYFQNTLFVFVGDHGVAGDAHFAYPLAWTEKRLTEEHIPLILYAPRWLKPQVRHETVSHIDVIPTIAGLLPFDYTNASLGRDALDPSKKQHMAFIMYHAPGWVGVVDDHYFYRKNIHMDAEELVSVKHNGIITGKIRDSLCSVYSQWTSAYYETSKWLLFNNRK